MNFMIQWLKNNRGFFVFLLCFGVFRTAVADWNPIPSGSMRPTLLEGDVVLVNRLAYDLKLPLTDVMLLRLGEPQRGDVVTFSSPKNGTRLIKRIVALPGDQVEMRDGVLVVNGEPALYSNRVTASEPVAPGVAVHATQATEHWGGIAHRVQYLQGATAERDVDPQTVPDGEYFMMGDNRDNSEDSRYIGTVPRERLIGRAHRVLVSADILGNWMPRWDRMVSRIQ
jgi:signal peptidase I